MRKLKKFFKILLITILILIGLLFATPYIFKSQIVSLVKKEVNRNLNAKVDFKDVDISFFRNFPRVSIGLDQLQVIGTDQFAADTLLSAKRLDATVDIMSFIRRKNMNIYNVFLESPRINAIINKDGLANWDIVKKAADKAVTDSADKPFNLQLNYYSIENGYLNYMDVPGNMSVVMENLNHSGTGDFTSNFFTLRTRSAADAISFNYGAIPYLSKVRSTVNTDIKIDNKNGVYSFDGIEMLLNELKVDGKGSIKKLAKGYAVDVSFKSPSADFKNLLSLITPIYQKEFNKITATGTALFEGYVKGVYADSVKPAYHLAMEVKDGSFKYTDL
ncbi:MAG: AsmA family protein, partial [Ferruginibacter sp.]